MQSKLCLTDCPPSPDRNFLLSVLSCCKRLKHHQSGLADGKVVLAQEGGYNVESNSSLATSLVNGWI